VPSTEGDERYDPEVDGTDNYQAALADLGVRGWELVGSYQGEYAFGGDAVLLFKRPKVSK
jgi:hypothetical protein